MLNSDDKEYVRLISQEITREVIASVLIEYAERCPHGKFLDRMRARVVGFVAGFALFHAVLTGVIVAVIGNFHRWFLNN